MLSRNSFRLSTLAMLMLSTACSGTKPPSACSLPTPPSEMMQPLAVTDFIAPELTSMGLDASSAPQPRKPRPSN